jgi:uncharacterized membrane protein
MTTESTETTPPPSPKHLFVLGFPDRAGADRAVRGLADLERSRFLKVTDHAIISKGEDGKLKIDENKDADHTAGRGAVTGGLAGAFVAVLAGPIGIGAVAVGAGIGAVANALHDSGFKTGDLKEVGSMMEGGRTLLLVAVRPDDAHKLHEAIGDLPELKAADRRWEAEVAGDSNNVLRDAIALWRQQQAEPAAEG